MMRLVRSAFVIARRDFSATVLSKAFIFFLLGPMFPLLLGGLFGGIGARVASSTEHPVVAVVMSRAEFAQLAMARQQLANAMRDSGIVELRYVPPEPDAKAQRAHLLASTDPPIRAVLYGSFDSPQLVGDVNTDGSTARQLKWLLNEAMIPHRAEPRLEVTEAKGASGSLASDRAITAQIGQMILFFLTILLSGMLLSQLIEEKSNKIIEVIAAAVPIDALFIGKLFAMLAASVVGIVVWVAAGAIAIEWLKTGGVATLPPPAVGWPAFLAFAVVYFAMNYLLLGAVFLTIGAQASTVREVQTMSMPVTFMQVLIFGIAATAIGAPDSPQAIGAGLFPLSSPMVMLARAAERPELWPHLAAIGWQLLWVAIILRVGARMFRKTVLKSGPRTKWWRPRRA
jgi:ABC-2 type transport system permease protein